MIIDVARLGEDEERFQGEDPGSILDLGADENLRVEGPVRYDLSASLVSGNLVVRGTVKADIAFMCVRCAEFFSVTVCEPSFSRVVEVADRREAVDLTEDIRESIILTFPINPQCAPDCRGICVQCGKNLNKAACECVPPSADDRWNTLNEIRLS